MVCDPGVERGGRLLQKRDLGQTRHRGRSDGQLARLFVEARGHCEDDILFLDGSAAGLFPRLAHVLQVAGRRFDWRQHASALLRIPRQDLGRAVYLGVGEPTLRGMDQSRGDQGALFSRELTHGFARIKEQKRWQRATRFARIGGDLLGNREDMNGREIRSFRLPWINEGQSAVRGAEVDADLHAFRFSRT